MTDSKTEISTGSLAGGARPVLDPTIPLPEFVATHLDAANFVPPPLVAPPVFDEPALSKPRPSAQQVAMLQPAAIQNAPARRSPTPQTNAQQSPGQQSLAQQSLAQQSLAQQSLAQQSPGQPAGAQQSLAQQSPGQRAAAEQRAARQAAVHRAAYQALAVMASAPAPSPTLRMRVPAFAVMKQCLKVQSAAPERSRLARLFGREPLHPDARSWYRGALGELEVARILGRLDKRWTVLHAVPVGSAGADIDHVVIGPGGTFTINTKNHSGKKIWTAGTSFMVNGQKLAHIHNSTFEAQRAARLLSDVAGTPVAVTPLIVVVDPESLTRKKPDVTVMESADLFRWLRRQPQMQTDATVARIVWAAERRATWTTLVDDAPDEPGHAGSGKADSGSTGSGNPGSGLAKVSPQSDADRIESRFAELRSAVESAESRRQAWSLLGAAAFFAAVIGAAMLVAPLIPELATAVFGG